MSVLAFALFHFTLLFVSKITERQHTLKIFTIYSSRDFDNHYSYFFPFSDRKKLALYTYVSIWMRTSVSIRNSLYYTSVQKSI